MTDRKPERPDIHYEHPLLDFPTGNGDKDCPTCKGRGVIPVMADVGGGVMWPGGGTQNCTCVFKRDLLANVKRVWKVLLNVDSVDASPLFGRTKQSLWITASSFDFRRHLRFVAFRMGPQWDARVVADATLMTAWLNTAKSVYDSDVLLEREGQQRDRPSEHFVTLVDLVVPFDLLIIVLGVKAAANKEMANVLAEALNEREQQGKPTWVVDSYASPLSSVSHKCHSPQVLEILDGFRRVRLEDERVSNEPATAAQQYPASRKPGVTPASPTSGSGGAAAPYTRRKGGMVQEGAPRAPYQPPEEVKTFLSMPMEDDGEAYEGEIPEPDEDDDEFSVDALMAAAHTPKLVPDGVGKLEDDTFNPDDLLEDFPSVEELGGNAAELPKWMTGALSKEERVAKQKQAKWAKKGRKNEGGR